MQTWIMHFCTYVVSFLLVFPLNLSFYRIHFYASPRFRGLFYYCLLLQFADLVYYSYRYEFVEKHSGITIFIRVKYYTISVIKNIFFRKSHETSVIVSFIRESIKIYPSIISSNISIIYYPNLFFIKLQQLEQLQ